MRDVANRLFKNSGYYAEVGQLSTSSDLVRDGTTLGRVAKWLDDAANSLRPEEDPLTITKNRGDPIVRGVLTVISFQLNESFGSPLYGTAATLTAVALGETSVTSRAARSALSGTKPR
jgi:hypothetical protein